MPNSAARLGNAGLSWFRSEELIGRVPAPEDARVVAEATIGPEIRSAVVAALRAEADLLEEIGGAADYKQRASRLRALANSVEADRRRRCHCELFGPPQGEPGEACPTCGGLID
jgi:hypothetical protein